jgi:hypothetical protein
MKNFMDSAWMGHEEVPFTVLSIQIIGGRSVPEHINTWPEMKQVTSLVCPA